MCILLNLIFAANLVEKNCCFSTCKCACASVYVYIYLTIFLSLSVLQVAPTPRMDRRCPCTTLELWTTELR